MRWVAVALAALLAGCGPTSGPETDRAAQAETEPVYLGVETQLLEDDLVQFFVKIAGPRDDAALIAYADCAAAQYALIRGYGFARHVRTTTSERSGVWRADAVYTISRALPSGRRTIDAEVVLAECKETGIPAV